MKKQFKLSLLAFTVLGALSTSSFAQNSEAVNPNQTINIGQANAFEKEVTPLLREISLKKSLLELRKVERELEKLDEEALKAQVDRETLLNQNNDKTSGAFASGPMGGVPLSGTPTSINGFGQGINSGVPTMPIVLGSNGSQGGMSMPLEANPNTIKILMIYGFSDNLYAKVAAGNQGGFVVKEGDILPDGRLVKKVTANYMEVQADNSGKKTKAKPKTERIFVSYTPAPERTMSSNLTPTSGSRVTPPDITRQIPPQMPVPSLTPLR